MINFSITWGDLALIVIAVVLLIAVIYLARFLREFMRTLAKVNSILTDNKKNIDGIIGNVDVITKDAVKITDKANNVAGELETTTTAVKADVLDPFVETLSTLVKIVQSLVTKKK